PGKRDPRWARRARVQVGALRQDRAFVLPVPACDDCAETSNPTRDDADGDDVGDACDSCPTVPETAQLDLDNDRVGNVCDNSPPAASPDKADGDGSILAGETYTGMDFGERGMRNLQLWRPAAKGAKLVTP